MHVLSMERIGHAPLAEHLWTILDRILSFFLLANGKGLWEDAFSWTLARGCILSVWGCWWNDNTGVIVV